MQNQIFINKSCYSFRRRIPHKRIKTLNINKKCACADAVRMRIILNCYRIACKSGVATKNKGYI